MTYYTDRIDYNDGRKRKNFNPKKYYKKDEPYVCPKCKRAWQPLRTFNENPEYLEDFPKLGCTNRICFNCKREKKNGTTKKT
mgnify:CR=1 FL=1|tara:strand:+ start:213 stop:458 length:246 start_codon:yes stop_codon:yes gene_type:complete